MKSKKIQWMLMAGCLLLTACTGNKETPNATEPIEDAVEINETEEVRSETEDVQTESEEEQKEMDETEFDLQNPVEDETHENIVYYEVSKDYKLEDGNVGAKIDFKIPQLKSDEHSLALINQDILDIYAEQMGTMDQSQEERLNEEDYWTKNEDGSVFPVYSTELTYDVSFLSDEYIGITFLGYDYEGGAHGLPYKFHNVYQLSDGKKISITDLVGVDKETFNQCFAEAFSDYISENPDEYWEDAIETVMEVTDYYEEKDCYLDQDGLTYYFYPYVLSYYANGYIEVTVPYDRLKMDME